MDRLHTMNKGTLEKINENTKNIVGLQLETDKLLKDLIYKYLFLGETLLNFFDEKTINSCTMTRFDKSLGNLSNFDYINLRKNVRYFFNGKNNIVEVYFEETLEVQEKIKFIDFSANIYTIELTFKSKRVKLVKEKIKFNRFRFSYSTSTGKMSCRVLNE